MNTPISELLARKPAGSVQTLPPTATVGEAVKLMNQHKFGCTLVTYAGRLVGIFTERDVLTRVLGRDREPGSTPLNEVMTVHPLTVLPSDTVEEVMAVITGHKVRRLPVIDRDGTIVGLISIGDLTRWLVETHRTGNLPNEDATKAADRQRGRRLHGLPPQPAPSAVPAQKARGGKATGPGGIAGHRPRRNEGGGRKSNGAASSAKKRAKGTTVGPRKPAVKRRLLN